MALATRVFRALIEQPDSVMGLHERKLAAASLIQRIVTRGKQAGFLEELRRDQVQPKSRPRVIYKLTTLGENMIAGPDPDGHLAWLSAREIKSPDDAARAGSAGAILQAIMGKNMTPTAAARALGVSRATGFHHVRLARLFVQALPAPLEELFGILEPQGIGQAKARALYNDLHALGALKFTAQGVDLSPQGEELARRIAADRAAA